MTSLSTKNSKKGSCFYQKKLQIRSLLKIKLIKYQGKVSKTLKLK